MRSVRLVIEAPTTVWHAWRRHVDLCRTSAAICCS
ncbi:putative leader peptide [Actinomycetospora succinea]